MNNFLGHFDDMLFDLLFKDINYIHNETCLQSALTRMETNLLVHIFSQVETPFVSDLDLTYMQTVYNSLDCLGGASGGCSKCKHPKMRVLCHEKTNNLRICIIATAFVCFVYVVRYSAA